jgi:GNAT superfamily N-acetyltransferase
VVENRGLGECHHDTIADVEPLDNPVWHALTGPQARFCDGTGLALRYDPEVAPFAAMPDEAGADAWDALAGLVGPGGAAVVFRGDGVDVPPAWEVPLRLSGLQMVAAGPIGEEDPEFAVLTQHDVPDMLALVARTRPGPFFTRTVELGTYLGLREEGTLVAMTGERLHPTGYTEISAVCTDESARKRGIATRLVRAVAAGIEARGETPILHVAAENVGAIRVYEGVGFETRVVSDFVMVQPPH